MGADSVWRTMIVDKGTALNRGENITLWGGNADSYSGAR
jgi:hypothetical protein